MIRNPSITILPVLGALVVLLSVASCGDDRGGGPATDSAGPIAIAGPDQSGLVGEALDFDGSESFAQEGGRLVSHTWDFGDGDSADGALTTHTYAETGAYNVVLEVIDDRGRDDRAALTVTIAAPDPTELTVDAADTAIMGEVYAAEATGVTGSEELTWDFGDGSSPVTGDTVTHVYEAWGEVTVTVTARGEHGSERAATWDVRVLARPTAVPGVDPDVAAVGQVVTFNGTGSSDPDGEIVTYAWNFGDDLLGQGVEVNHTYAADGSYNILLTVTDDDGLQHSTGFKLTVEGGQAPIANCGAANRDVQVGVPTPFDGSGSTDPDGEIVSYTWTFSDSPDTAAGQRVEHTFATEGSYTADLVVIDDSGLEGSARCLIGAVDVPFAGMDGTYNAGPALDYSCSLGMVHVTVDQFQFSTAGSAMTIRGLPGGLFQTTVNLSESPAPAGMHFNAAQSILGTPPSNCDEYYRLEGDFSDNDHWVGTFTTEFLEPNNPGVCGDCAAQSFSVTGSRVH